MRQLERGGQSLFPSGQEAGCEYLINSHQYAGGFTVVCCGTQTPAGEPNAQTRAMEHEHSSTESGCDTSRVEVPRWASRLLSLFFFCHNKLCHTAYGRRVFFYCLSTFLNTNLLSPSQSTNTNTFTFPSSHESVPVAIVSTGGALELCEILSVTLRLCSCAINA